MRLWMLRGEVQELGVSCFTASYLYPLWLKPFWPFPSVQYVLQLPWHWSRLGDGRDPAQATAVIQIGLCWACGWLTAKMVNFVNWSHTVDPTSASVGTVAEAWLSYTITDGMARGPSTSPHHFPQCTFALIGLNTNSRLLDSQSQRHHVVNSSKQPKMIAVWAERMFGSEQRRPSSSISRRSSRRSSPRSKSA